jgi:chaperonin GroEL (HSP60 family)
MREVSMQTNDIVGNGATTATLLARALLNGLEDLRDSTGRIKDHVQNPIR